MKLKDLLVEFESTPKGATSSQARTGSFKTPSKTFFLGIEPGILRIMDEKRKSIDSVRLETKDSSLCNTRFRATFKNTKGTVSFDVDLLTPKWDDVKAKGSFDNLKFDSKGNAGIDVTIISGGSEMKIDVSEPDTMVVKATNFCVDNLED